MKEKIVKALTDATDEIFLEMQGKLHVVEGCVAPDAAFELENAIGKLADIMVTILDNQPKLAITSIAIGNMSFDATTLANDYETFLALKKIEETIKENHGLGTILDEM